MTLEELRKAYAEGKLVKQFFPLENDVYRSGPGISFSNIKEIFEPNTPQNFKIKLGQVREQTPAMKIGTATHLGILQHEEFIRSVRVAPDVNKRTKAGKEELQTFLDENEGKIILSNDELEKIEGMSEKCLSHPRLSGLINDDKNLIEHRGYFNWNGLFCKFSPDLLNRSKGLIVDLKTAQAGHYYAFRNEIRQYNYDAQAAMYLYGARQIFNEKFQFMWLVIEKHPPFQIYLYYPSKRMILKAFEKLESAVKLIAKCYKENNFPGVPVEAMEIDFPDYHYREENDVFTN